LSLLALAAVAAVNAAGLWSIRASKRGAIEEVTRLFGARAEARARVLERRLGAIRSDLAFLADSGPVQGVLLGPPEGGARRQAAEAALLLFLRAHPEVMRLALLDRDSRPLILVGSRGGVPILWVAENPTGNEGPALSPDRPRVASRIPVGAESGASLDSEIAPSVLLADSAEDALDRPACRLVGPGSRLLARDGTPPEGRTIAVAADVAAPGWTVGTPWQLLCGETEAAGLALVEPVAARSRTSLFLNLGAMATALLLGLLAVREVRERERAEARTRAEVQVRELEKQVFHQDRLASLGRLAAGIAHEINNPLEGMANYMRLAQDALARGDLEAAKARLGGVAQGLDRAALVVRQVLAHADPARSPTSPVDLNTVLRETTEFVRSRPEFARIRFETALSDGPLVVQGSQIMLGQVALNLIVNACEAQPGKGEVRVSSDLARGQARVEVADRGEGIPEALRERIFEPFFSTKNSTGLGLSICYSIVREHGGNLEACAREGGGTVLRMTLPSPPLKEAA
jgi:signal transduction histidine kinase